MLILFPISGEKPISGVKVIIMSAEKPMANMANIKDGLSRRWPSHVAEKFIPTTFWAQDSEGNYLLYVHIPGFKYEEVKMALDSDGDHHIKIEGERLVDENKCIYFDETVPLPENSDTPNIIGNFEGEHLLIKVPKINVEEDSENIGNGHSSTAEERSQEEEESNKKQKNQTKHEQAGHAAAGQSSRDSNKKEMGDQETCRVADFPKEIIKRWEGEDNPLEIVIKCLKGNKGIVLAVVLSFSIGVWVSKLW